MNQSTGTANWIGAYLEWTDAGSFIGAREHIEFGGAEAADAGPAEAYTAAYLEWIDAAPPVRARPTQYRARDARDGGADVLPGSPAGGTADGVGLHQVPAVDSGSRRHHHTLPQLRL